MSKTGHIRVYDQGPLRSLSFKCDDGKEKTQTSIFKKNPELLVHEYTRNMFVSLLINPGHKKTLLAGLGGGCMIHFIRHYLPDVKLDVVEIDPVIIRIAKKYFGIKDSYNIKIYQDDILDFLKSGNDLYDVIYMDAFLRPSDITDQTGMPLSLKEGYVLDNIKARLEPQGMAVFNINYHNDQDHDIAAIKKAFPVSYVIRPVRSGNTIVAGYMNTQKLQMSELYSRARRLDRRLAGINFSFEEIVQNLY